MLNLFDQFSTYQSNMTEGMVQFLADDLNVSTDAIKALGVGFSPHEQAWIFAEHNAKGEIIAFIDSDCISNPGWLSGISSAHRSENAAVGGPVINGNPHNIISWAGYLIEFNEWLPGNSRGFMQHIPTCNISYKKRVFEQSGGFSTFYPLEDRHYNFKLVEAGEKILFEPNLGIRHSHRIRLRNFIAHQFRRGKAGYQIRKKIPIRGAYLVNYPYLAPLLLPKRIIAITARFLKSRPTNIIVFLSSLPFIVLGVACWIAGFLRETCIKKT